MFRRQLLPQYVFRHFHLVNFSNLGVRIHFSGEVELSPNAMVTGLQMAATRASHVPLRSAKVLLIIQDILNGQVEKTPVLQELCKAKLPVKVLR